jgi:putative transposase
VDEQTATGQTVQKACKFKLRPTAEQEQVLEHTLELCRRLYNCVLEQRIAWWRRGQGKAAAPAQQEAELPDLKTACPEYQQVHSQVLQNVLARLDTTYQAFFRRVANGEKAGFPRFQGRTRYHSFTFKQFGNGAILENGCLVLAKIGGLAVRWSRPLVGTPKTVTISREADGWYVSFSCAQVSIRPLPPTGRATGIDVGLKVFLVTAEGETVANSRHYRQAEQRLAKAQKRLSRRKKGSKRREKARKLVAKHHQKVRRQRRDFHHKTALWLVRQYEVMYLEDLRVANLVRNRHLSKSISDAAWGQFRTILAAKAAYAGRQMVAVPPHYTSQDCSGVRADGRRCGARVEKSLSVRTHVCPDGGLVLDRDQNAALNILRAGQARRGAVGPPAVLERESPGFSR